MAAANEKTTYTAVEVAALESRIQQQQDEIDALKKKLDNMNEVFANAQLNPCCGSRKSLRFG